jgi:hypothetical protein
MFDETSPRLLFVLTVICVLLAAPMAYFSNDPPTTMQTRFMDGLLVVVAGGATALITLLKRPNDKGKR